MGVFTNSVRSKIFKLKRLRKTPQQEAPQSVLFNKYYEDQSINVYVSSHRFGYRCGIDTFCSTPQKKTSRLLLSRRNFRGRPFFETKADASLEALRDYPLQK
jgi:hypothetical protein